MENKGRGKSLWERIKKLFTRKEIQLKYRLFNRNKHQYYIDCYVGKDKVSSVIVQCVVPGSYKVQSSS